MTSDFNLNEENVAEILIESLCDEIANLPVTMKNGDLNAFIETGRRIISLEIIVKACNNGYFFSNVRSNTWLQILFGTPSNPEKKAWVWFYKGWLKRNWRKAEKLNRKLNGFLDNLLASKEVVTFNLFKDKLSMPEMAVVFAAVKLADAYSMGFACQAQRIWEEPTMVNRVEDFIFSDDEEKQ